MDEITAKEYTNKKRLLVFCDGTWNSADQREYNGQRCPTNVTRLFEATKHTGFDSVPQIAIYIAGVGTGKLDRLLGGGFGFGISKNIQEAYRFIVSNYETGDDVFLFGFSRGAYTARSIAGLIDNMGILRRENLHLVNEAYDHYRDKTDEWKIGGKLTIEFQKKYCHENDRIKFLGVWDTVGALGSPFGVLMAKLTDLIFHTSFHVVDFSGKIESAFHALAIDEKRWPFRPTPLNLQQIHMERNNEAAANKEQLPYEEKWFPGVHSNIGGGYAETGLSDCALEWMIERSAYYGLGVEKDRLDDLKKFLPKPCEKIENSMTPFYQLATFFFVYLFKPILKYFCPDDAEKLDRVNWKGEYTRIIKNQKNVGAAVKAYPTLIGYEGSISKYAIEKLKDCPDTYNPANIDL